MNYNLVLPSYLLWANYIQEVVLCCNWCRWRADGTVVWWSVNNYLQDWEYQDRSDALSLITIPLSTVRTSLWRVPTEVGWYRGSGKGFFVREGMRIRVDQSETKLAHSHL